MLVVAITKVKLDPGQPIRIGNVQFRAKLETIAFHFDESITLSMFSWNPIMILKIRETESWIP